MTRLGTFAGLLFLAGWRLRMLFGVDGVPGVSGGVGGCLVARVGDFDALRAFAVGFLIRVDRRSAIVFVTSDCKVQAVSLGR